MPRRKKNATKEAKPVTVVVKEKPQKKKQSVTGQLLSGAGRLVGGLVGFPEVGASAGSYLSKVLGMGAYRVKSNVFATSPDSIPNFNSKVDGEIIITHAEMLTDVLGSVTSTSTTFDIHPGNKALFPWLANLATSYEQYEFLGLLFCYKPTSGSAIASTNNSLGTVVLATEYDISRPVFVSKAEMESYEYSTSCVPSASMIHPVECNPKADIINARYTQGPARSIAAASSSLSSPSVMENLHVLGRLQMMTVGMQAAVTVGELWVTYKIKLTKARPLPTGYPDSLFHAGSNNQSLNVSGDGPFKNRVVYSNSTSSLNTIGITNDTTLSFAGQPPFTNYLIFSTVLTSGGNYTAGARTYTNLTDLGNIFFATATNTGTTEIECGAASTSEVFATCVRTKFDNYTNPASWGFAAPTLTSGNYKWDLWVFTFPSLDSNATALSISKQEEYQQIYDRIMSDLRLPPLRTISEDEDEYKMVIKDPIVAAVSVGK